jgi:hypothetical protein
MKLRELIEEKIIPNTSDKEDKKIRRRLRIIGKKERETMLNTINTIRKSEGIRPFTTRGLHAELGPKLWPITAPLKDEEKYSAESMKKKFGYSDEEWKEFRALAKGTEQLEKKQQFNKEKYDENYKEYKQLMKILRLPLLSVKEFNENPYERIHQAEILVRKLKPEVRKKREKELSRPKVDKHGYLITDKEQKKIYDSQINKKAFIATNKNREKLGLSMLSPKEFRNYDTAGTKPKGYKSGLRPPPQGY